MGSLTDESWKKIIQQKRWRANDLRLEKERAMRKIKHKYDLLMAFVKADREQAIRQQAVSNPKAESCNRCHVMKDPKYLVRCCHKDEYYSRGNETRCTNKECTDCIMRCQNNTHDPYCDLKQYCKDHYEEDLERG